MRKFYDNAYHLHKATFKGSSEFFKAYGEIEKDYAGALLKLSENGKVDGTQSQTIWLI